MTGDDEVARLVAVITMDCYNLAEQVTAFYETFAEEVPLPTTATVIGTTIQVVGIDIADHGEALTARCHRGDVVQTCTFRTWCLLPIPRLDGFTRPTATALAWCHTRPPYQEDGSRPGCERQIAYPGRRGRVISPPMPVNRSLADLNVPVGRSSSEQ
jgi:hypothetical protein